MQLEEVIIRYESSSHGFMYILLKHQSNTRYDSSIVRVLAMVLYAFSSNTNLTPDMRVVLLE